MTALLNKNIIHGCLNGDEKSRIKLYNFTAPKMLGVCYRYAGNYELAEEILLEGFVYAFENFHLHINFTSSEEWLETIMVEKSVALLIRLPEFINSVSRGYPVTESNSPVDKLVQFKAGDLIEILCALPLPHRLAINLFSIEGYSYEHISKLMMCEENQCRTLYAQGRLILARILESRGRIQSVSDEIYIIKH